MALPVSIRECGTVGIEEAAENGALHAKRIRDFGSMPRNRNLTKGPQRRRGRIVSI
jgi:hypothetical protein